MATHSKKRRGLRRSYKRDARGRFASTGTVSKVLRNKKVRKRKIGTVKSGIDAYNKHHHEVTQLLEIVFGTDSKRGIISPKPKVNRGGFGPSGVHSARPQSRVSSHNVKSRKPSNGARFTVGSDGVARLRK